MKKFITNIIFYIKIFIFYLGIIPATLLISTVGMLSVIAPDNIRYKIITSWSHFFIFWAKLICGINYQVIGKENLNIENSIAVSNHQSTWETIFMQVLLPKQSWILKREILSIPFFGWALWLLKPIDVDRKNFNTVKQVISKGVKRLREGRWVIIFPEGTRRPYGQLGKFSRSAAALSVESGKAIIPIAHNAGLFWPRGPFFKQSGIITVKIGKPIYPKDKDTDEVNKLTKEWISSTLEKI